MIFFQRYKAKQAGEIEPPAVEPPPLPAEEKTGPTNTIQPIHIDDAQYLQLTRALRPKAEPVFKSVSVEVPAPNTPVFLDESDQLPRANPHPSSPEQPPGTPIV